ncbi:MAG: class I SAM-dependent methyltransferase [Deltaproteobacteria bacterium]|nr:class I SAM-dependent methyltransferase [Deltaproteobacteria bacterium]
MKNLQQTADFWDQLDTRRPLQFWDLAEVLRYRNKLISGRDNLGFLDWFKQCYVKRPFRTGLSLGCGAGEFDRRAWELGIVENLVGIDVAPHRLKTAQKLSVGMPLVYIQQNLNTVQLPHSGYDFCLCKMILHHIEDLEHLFGELRQSLRPGGLLYIDEYVGPNRFQFDENHLKIADEVLQTIPEELRGLRYDPQSVKKRINRINPLVIQSADPSEALRSSEIDRLLKNHFSVLAEHGTGGSLLFRLLDGIAHNFNEDITAHKKIIQALCDFEAQLTRQGILKDIFKVYVVRNDK